LSRLFGKLQGIRWGSHHHAGASNAGVIDLIAGSMWSSSVLAVLAGVCCSGVLARTMWRPSSNGRDRVAPTNKSFEKSL